MNEMLERVAFEMQRYDLEECTDGTFMIIDGYRIVKVREGLTSADEPLDVVNEMNARAAVGAMREPTDEMWESAKRHMDSPSSNLAWWRAMIDEILK